MWPRAVFWSDVLDGFLVSSSHYRQRYSYTGSGSLLRDGHVVPLASGGIDFAIDLPRFGVAALLDSSRLSFVDPRGIVQKSPGSIPATTTTVGKPSTKRAMTDGSTSTAHSTIMPFGSKKLEEHGRPLASCASKMRTGFLEQ
jgi:hypothetical protein